jgi:hypothetical protein
MSKKSISLQVGRRSLLLLALIATGFLATAQAQETNFLRRLLKSHLNFEVRVTDADGHALPGAWLWIVESADSGLKSGTPDLPAVTRMADRYWKEADFIGEDLPGFVFHRVDPQGQYRKDREYTSYHSSGGYPFILVATRRGYLPQVIEGNAPLNRHHLVSVVLQPDPQAPVADARMKRFDDIMALARNTLPGEEFMGVPRLQRLIALERELRELALALERDGKKDEASALYWALADFPEVKHATAGDGSLQILGYANGRTGPASEADRTRATQLSTKVPKFLIAQRRMTLGHPRTGIRNAEQGRGYLDAFYAVRKGGLGERLTPREYRVAIFQAIEYGSAEEACELMQQAYRFEPFTMKLQDWWARMDDIAKRSAQQGLQPVACVIDGLPGR